MERRSSKEYSVVFFGGRQKVQITKFAFEDSFFVVGSAANSVGATLEFAVFCSSSDPKHSRALAPSGFFCPQPWFLRSEKHSPGPNCDQ